MLPNTMQVAPLSRQGCV
uniref:Uncharacterized protein n=1 Tax=Anguilla anguilla TaxID=7936 RepID=A0A0E9V2P5_ANGAN